MSWLLEAVSFNVVTSVHNRKNNYHICMCNGNFLYYEVCSVKQLIMDPNQGEVANLIRQKLGT